MTFAHLGNNCTFEIGRPVFPVFDPRQPQYIVVRGAGSPVNQAENFNCAISSGAG